MSDKIQASDVAALIEGWRKAVQEAAREYKVTYERSYQETITDYIQANKDTLKANISREFKCEVEDVYYDREKDAVVATAMPDLQTFVIDLIIPSADFVGDKS